MAHEFGGTEDLLRGKNERSICDRHDGSLQILNSNQKEKWKCFLHFYSILKEQDKVF